MGRKASPAAERNARLHQEYTKLKDDLEAAGSTGDSKLQARLTNKLDLLGGEFFTANQSYARSLAFKWSGNNRSNGEEYLATAYEKLWAAFVSWDPSKGTFTTWARSHIEGGVRREVRRQEFGERSYDDFTARQQIASMVEKLRESTGRTPSIDELVAATGIEVVEIERLDALAASLTKVSPAALAAAASVSEKRAKRYLESRKRLAASLGRPATAQEVSADTGLSRGVVERALIPRTARLDAPTRSQSSSGDDGGSRTLGDRLADTADGQVLLEDDREWLAYLAETLEGLSGQEIWFLLRTHGLDGAWPQTIRELSAQTDLGRESARKIADVALGKLSGPLPQLIE